VIEESPDIPQLASSYRRLVLWFGAQLLLGLLQGVAIRIGGGLGQDLYYFASIGVPVTIIAFAYHGYHTARALDAGLPWLWAVAMLVPFLNVVALLWLSSLSTKACKKAGVSVGLLGPKV
jgi:hypothetical protein